MPTLDEGKQLHAAAKAIKYEARAGGCWICTSHHRSFYDYPYLKRDGIHWQMHRYVYQLRVGDLSPGDTVHHTCGNASCINPEHLVLNKEHYHRGIPDETREQVRHLHAGGLTYDEISERFNIGRTSVWRIINEDSRSSDSSR